MNYESVEVYNPDKEPGKGKLEALKAFNSIFGPDKDYSLEGSMSKNAQEAQMSFLRGEAAMNINASWLETEMIEDIPEGFNLRFMPYPYLENAKKDPETGKYISVNYATNPDFMIVPKAAPQKEGAKKFLAFMSKDDMLRYFTKWTGSLRPFEYDVEPVMDNLSTFAKDVIKINETAESYFPIRTGKYKTCMDLQIWIAGYPYTLLVQGKDGMTPERYCRGQYLSAKEDWQSWTGSLI